MKRFAALMMMFFASAVSFILLSVELPCDARAEDWSKLAALYEPVLDEWATGLAADPEDMLERDSIENARRNVWMNGGRDPLEAIGYTYLDMDSDGSPELVIGTVDAKQHLGTDIFEIITIEKGRPVTILQGWERNRLSITYDDKTGRNGFYQEGSSSAFNSVYLYCPAGWQDAQLLEANTDFDSDKTVWTLNGKEMAEKQAQELIGDWQAQMTRVSMISCAERDELEERRGFVDDLTPRAAGAYCRTGRVTADGPMLDIMITDTGRTNPPEAWHEHILSVSVSVRGTENGFSFEYDSDETPEASNGWIFEMKDVNFDGYKDLVLVTARGASIEFTIFGLWNPETDRFDRPMTYCPFDLDNACFSQEVVPIELANYSLRKGENDFGYLISYENDGVVSHTQSVYRYEQKEADHVLLTLVHDVQSGYGDQHDCLRERVFAFGSRREKVWDHLYPEDWYGDTMAYNDHWEAVQHYRKDADPQYMAVANVDWVNLRELDSKQSRSLARLNRGTEVRVLKENCADGWTMVLWNTGEPQNAWFGDRTEIGYIWHSYLE
ncbi:MAG: hypothetical protein IJ189_00395 [Clostridia bacterium]|nr:hypothetical protein [Clostridia bacterium]